MNWIKGIYATFCCIAFSISFIPFIPSIPVNFAFSPFAKAFLGKSERSDHHVDQFDPDERCDKTS